MLDPHEGVVLAFGRLFAAEILAGHFVAVVVAVVVGRNADVGSHIAVIVGDTDLSC